MSSLLSEEDRTSGEVDVLSGIAHGSGTGCIFVTGRLCPKLFQYEVIPPKKVR
jgi:glutamine cyclotransferase